MEISVTAQLALPRRPLCVACTVLQQVLWSPQDFGPTVPSLSHPSSLAGTFGSLQTEQREYGLIGFKKYIHSETHAPHQKASMGRQSMSLPGMSQSLKT